MKKETGTPSDKRHRFPPAIIGHAIRLYCRFARRYRDVAERLAERGVILTYETIRQWCRKFGRANANALRRRRPRPGDKWHLDEVFVSSNGPQLYLWRAVDQDGQVLDILVQARRDKAAAVKFLRKLRKGLADVPRVLITDKLAGDGAAQREVLPRVGYRQHKRLNTLAEHAHQPTRERERRMRRCKSPGHAQRFLVADGPIAGHFRRTLRPGAIVTRARSAAAQGVRVRPAELAAPLADRLVYNHPPTLGKQFLHVAIAQGEAAVQPHRVGDDRGWEAVTFIGGRYAHLFHVLRIACGAVWSATQLT